MSHSNRSYKLFALLAICALIFTPGSYNAAAVAPTQTLTAVPSFTPGPSLTPTPTFTITPTITLTPAPTKPPTPIVRADADPVAWPDGAIDLEQFPPKGTLVIHFNTPMQPDSSPNPVLVWPSLQGAATWNEARTALTFAPASLLDAQKAYTFFLDPALRAANGKALKDAPEWVAHVQTGPSVLDLTPKSGTLANRQSEIEIDFDRDMDTTAGKSILSIEPAVPFELTWTINSVLKIKLLQPLEYNQRYDLTLSGGGGPGSLFAADGSYLAEDYRWFYALAPFEVSAALSGPATLELNFKNALEQSAGNLPFSIAPALDGEWKWTNPNQATFTASQAIPASQAYTLTFTGPLTDMYGVKTTVPPAIKFSGLPPIHLVEQGIEKSKYSREDYWVANVDLEAIKLQFDTLVEHASAEKAFSLTPAAPGKFQWEKSAGGETLTYTLDALLKPDTQYMIGVATTVTDAQGGALITQPYQQPFYVSSSWSLSPTFGQYGDNIQVVDAGGPRKLQFDGGDDTTFSAYRFDLIDFAKLYADHYSYRSSGNKRDIPIPDGAKPVSTWSNVSTRTFGQGEDQGSVEETALPGELAPGLYIVNMRSKDRLYDQIFLVVTRNTLVVKNNGDSLFVWLTNINGKNVADAEIRVYSASGEKIREGKTDGNGQYRVPIPAGTEPMLVSARTQEKNQPEDVTISGFNGWEAYEPYNYNDPSRYLPEGQPYLAYVYTERPIYRPGQTVNFKAIVRKDNDVRYELPKAGTLVKVRVLDSRGNTVESFDLHTNSFGTVNGAVDIADGAMLGAYQIETTVEGVVTAQPFKVEDYRKPDYQITITSLQPEKKDRFSQGEEVKMQINVAYYFGEPLADTNLDINFYHTELVQTSISGSTSTDKDGNATISFPAPYDASNNNYYYGYGDEYQTIRMEVTADDGSNQTVSSAYNLDVYPAAERLSLDTGGYYFAPDQTVTVRAQDKDLFDQPVAKRDLTLTIKTWVWTKFDYDTTEQTYKLQTDAQGKAAQQIKLVAGYYELSLSGKDTLGNDLTASNWLYVFKEGSAWFQRNKDQQLSISADKDSYKPYERARFAIESTFSGPALLTFERGSVINTKIIELKAPLTIIETDIIPEHAPNVYVTVNAWQAPSQDAQPFGSRWYTVTASDSYLRLASTQIRVDASAKALNISIQTDKQVYAPGEKVSAVIKVKDAAGKPALAELSLAVVDEAIFALAADPSMAIFDAFYGPRQHTVDTFDSMAPSRVIFDGGGRGGGGGGEAPPAARSNFPDTSAWFPVIETDANGQAKITFDLPDNTTSWRLTVKAVTLNHQVGQAQANIETQKEVFVRPSLPRVLTSGDQATLTAFVHNYGASARTVKVNLSADGLEVQGQNDQQVTLQPGAVKAVGWRVHVSGAKPTEVTVTVQGASGVLDAVRLPLLLQPAAVKDVQNQSGQFSGTLTLALPLPRLERQTSQVYLTLNRTMSGTLLNGLEYLTGYPYGCVEQTMSRALPNAVVSRASAQLGIGGPALQARLDPLIKASIQRLYGFQHNDGGWGWWTDDESTPYQTAWVLFGLGLMDDAGYPIEPKVMDDAAAWLKYGMKSSESDIRTNAYALYSLAEAGRGDKEATLALAAASIKELDPFSQAALALALARLDEKEQAQTILTLLAQSALQRDGQVYWPQPGDDGTYYHKTMASTTRATALVLLAFATIDPKNELIPGMVQYLAGQRRGIYGWGSTNETSFTILALTEYLKTQEDAAGKTPYDVSVNGKSLFTGTLETGNASISLDIPLDQLKDGLNTLLVTTQGDHPLYFDLSTRYDLLQTDAAAAGKIIVKRRYLDPETDAPLEALRAGQLVKVELSVEVPQDSSFLAVEDYLPGGLEALNEGLNTTNYAVSQSEYEDLTHYYWKDYGYNYKEIRGDRVVFFITTFDKGERTFTYYARATTAGQFTALPTQAYAMYDLGMWGRSAGGQILIK
ncbi:MAG: Ig-like domain-containing protein [Anaerolineales bacterium]